MDIDKKKNITYNMKKGDVLDTSLPQKRKRRGFIIPNVKPKQVKREVSYKKTEKNEIITSEQDTLGTIHVTESRITRNMQKKTEIINTQGKDENSIIKQSISKYKDIFESKEKEEKSHLNLISNKILESLDKTFFYDEDNEVMLNGTSAQCKNISNNAEQVCAAPLIDIQNITNSKKIQIREESKSGNITLKEPNQEKDNELQKRNKDDSYEPVITGMNMLNTKGDILEKLGKKENTNENVKKCELNTRKGTEKIRHKDEADLLNMADKDITEYIKPVVVENVIDNFLDNKYNLDNPLMKNLADLHPTKTINIRLENTDFEINKCNEFQNLNKSCTKHNSQVEHTLESQIPIEVEGNKNINNTETAYNNEFTFINNELTEIGEKDFTKIDLNHSSNILMTSNLEGQVEKLEESDKYDIDSNTKNIYNKQDYQQSVLQNNAAVQNIPIEKINKLKPEFNNFNTTNVLDKNLGPKEKKISIFSINALDYSKILKRNKTEFLNENSKNQNIQSHIKHFKDSADTEINSKCFSTLENLQDISNFYESNNLNKLHSKCNTPCNLQQQHICLLNFLEMQQNILEGNRDLKDPLTYDRLTMKSKFERQFQIADKNFSINYEINDNYTNNCNIQIDKIQNTELIQNKQELPKETSDEINYSQQLTKNEVNTENGELNEQLNKNFQDAEKTTTFLITARDCFKTEDIKNDPSVVTPCQINTNRTTIEIGKDEEIMQEKDITYTQNSEDNFDLDDDFTLTASQLSMIKLNETNQILNEKKNFSQQTEYCSNTHFGLDSVTVEIIDQLHYIRETVDSIRGLLQASQKKQ